MAASQRRIRYEVDGTAARAYAVPQREERPQYNTVVREEELKVRRRQQELEERNQERKRREQLKVAPQSAAPAVDRIAMVVLSFAIVMTFAVCFSYLQVQADIAAQNKEIARLESLTKELKTRNDIVERRIEDSIDLAQIQTVAMEELGMVYPYQDQMISYETGSRGYVRQYGELLGNEQETLMETVMGLLLSYGRSSVEVAQPAE